MNDPFRTKGTQVTKQIEDALADSNPWTTPDDPALSASISELVADSRVAAAAETARARRRPLWVLPLAGVAALALTAGAVVVTDNLLHADLPIAIDYVTDTGVNVSCTAQIQGGSLFTPRANQVIDYYRTHDFSDVGQRIYDYALVLTGDRPATPGVLPKSSIWVPEPGHYLGDQDAYFQSLTSFLLTDIQVDLHFSGSGDSWMTSDCTGRMH